MKRFCFLPLMLIALTSTVIAQNHGQREIKANSPAYTGEFFITPLDRNRQFMTTKLRIGPGGYNEWHIHPDAEQTMFVIEGEGYYQEEGKPLQLLKAGDCVKTPANIRHWNGSTPNDSVTVITITSVNEKPHVEWLGKIDPEIFNQQSGE